MQSNTRPWIVGTGLMGALILLFSFQNCAPMLPLEGVATVNSNARATATPGPLTTPDPDSTGYTQTVIDGVCSDNTATDTMAVTYTTAATGSVIGFKNSSTKQAAFWKVSSGNVIHGIVCSIQKTPTADELDPEDNYWELAAIGDFNGDGNQDILWRNSRNSKVAVWLMNGANRTYTAVLNNGATTPIDLTMGSDWNIEGVGLFSGTGRYSVLWRNTSGAIVVWDMNGISTPTSKSLSIASAPSGYKIAGLGDFDGNYRSDILFRSGSSHVIWSLGTDGITVETKTFADSLPSTYEIKVIGDFNGDARADLLLQNSTSKAMEVRYMNDTAQLTTALSITAPASGWTLKFAQDVTTDSVADWIWQIPGSGDPYVAYTPMSGSPGTTRTLGTIKTGWAIFEYSHL